VETKDASGTGNVRGGVGGTICARLGFTNYSAALGDHLTRVSNGGLLHEREKERVTRGGVTG
jgi:hypothetical protein